MKTTCSVELVLSEIMRKIICGRNWEGAWRSWNDTWSLSQFTIYSTVIIIVLHNTQFVLGFPFFFVQRVTHSLVFRT